MSIITVDRPGKSLPAAKPDYPKPAKRPPARKGGVRYLITSINGGVFRILPSESRNATIEVGYSENAFDEAIAILSAEYRLNADSVKLAREYWKLWRVPRIEAERKHAERVAREAVDRQRKLIVNRVRDYVNRCPDDLLGDFDIEVRHFLQTYAVN